MALDEALALMWFISVIGIIVFALSAVVNYFRKQTTKEDWKKSLFFLILSVILLVLFSGTMN